MKNLLIHSPEGFRDVYGEEARKKRIMMKKLHGVFEEYQYSDIEPPCVEYFDVFGSDVGTTPSKELYKFFDRDGNTLVLRPDFTPSVARAVAMHFPEDRGPFKLCYEGKTFVNSHEYRLNMKETTQMGVELIGDGSPEADAEVIALTCDLLKEAGLNEFQVSVGEVDFFKSLINESGFEEERIEEIRKMISNKNFFGVGEVLESENIDPALCEALTYLPQLFGGEEILDTAESYALNEGAKDAIRRLRVINDILRKNGYEKYVSYDFGTLNKYHYYTGIIFSAFTYGSGEPVAKGGRYDNLLGHFGRDLPAVGVGVYIEQLMIALMRQDKRLSDETNEINP